MTATTSGWKLAWVLSGWTGAELLDSYERERRPVAEHNVARSADMEGSMREADRALQVDLGNRLPHAWVPTRQGRVSTLDLLGPGLTLFTGPEDTTWDVTATLLHDRVPLVIRRLDAISARALGIGPGGALLARPDGAPAALWPQAGTFAAPREAIAV